MTLEYLAGRRDDPGNFATNVQAGAKYGCSLLWVKSSPSMCSSRAAVRGRYGEPATGPFSMPVSPLMYAASATNW